MTRPILQKLLTTPQAEVLGTHGYAHVAGVVIELGNMRHLDGPQGVLRAYGIDAPDATSVHVVRYETPPVAELTRPSTDPTERSWPTFPSGFLRSEPPVPVWVTTRTRYPVDAELWRLGTDGEELVSQYRGAAHGWSGARGWNPPSTLVGLRAEWQDDHYAADLVDDGQVMLTRLGGDDLPGWERVRPEASLRVVPLSEVASLFEFRAESTVDGLPVRILGQGSDATVHVQFEPGDVDAILATGAQLTEPEVFEMLAPRERMTDPEMYTAVPRATPEEQS